MDKWIPVDLGDGLKIMKLRCYDDGRVMLWVTWSGYLSKFQIELLHDVIAGWINIVLEEALEKWERNEVS